MRIAVLSGKGGTGKTFVSVNLAAVSNESVYIDCDVEEPNGKLFFQPEHTEKKEVSVLLPDFEQTKCTGCRDCVNFCKFNALAFIKGEPRVFKEICHSCGGCKLVCKHDAITEAKTPVGFTETGVHGKTKVITGELNIGEASGVPVIRDALKTGFSANAETTIIDCPPGSACSVTESISEADYCLLVAEPTVFGFHNFKMVAELVKIMKKNCGVVINKYDGSFPPLESFCRENNMPVLAKIPYSKETAHIISKGQIASEKSSEIHLLFRQLLTRIGGVL